MPLATRHFAALCLLSLGCAGDRQVAETVVDSPPQLDASVVEASETPETPALPPYDDVLAGLEEHRQALSERYALSTGTAQAEVLASARKVVEDAIIDDIFPQWYGTTWDFYGTTTTPRQGTIACGYFVSTVLEQAGFHVERVKMAQQASEYIILSLVPRYQVQRFRGAPVEQIVEAVNAGGEGLYLVGLDFHVGFLTKRGDAVQMCHSSYLGEAAVLCEDALTSPALVSQYRVLGKLMSDVMMRAWLEGLDLPTVLP